MNNIEGINSVMEGRGDTVGGIIMFNSDLFTRNTITLAGYTR